MQGAAGDHKGPAGENRARDPCPGGFLYANYVNIYTHGISTWLI